MSDLAAMTEGKEAPACSLPPNDMLDRIANWKSIAQEALSRTTEPGKVVSIYPRREDMATRLDELIEAEASCCPFLAFDLRERDEVIEVELRYPPEFEAVVTMIVLG